MAIDTHAQRAELRRRSCACHAPAATNPLPSKITTDPSSGSRHPARTTRIPRTISRRDDRLCGIVLLPGDRSCTRGRGRTGVKSVGTRMVLIRCVDGLLSHAAPPAVLNERCKASALKRPMKPRSAAPSVWHQRCPRESFPSPKEKHPLARHWCVAGEPVCFNGGLYFDSFADRGGPRGPTR